MADPGKCSKTHLLFSEPSGQFWTKKGRRLWVTELDFQPYFKSDGSIDMDFKAEDLEDFMRQARDQPLRVKVQPLRQFLFVILLSYNFILILFLCLKAMLPMIHRSKCYRFIWNIFSQINNYDRIGELFFNDSFFLGSCFRYLKFEFRTCVFLRKDITQRNSRESFNWFSHQIILETVKKRSLTQYRVPWILELSFLSF